VTTNSQDSASGQFTVPSSKYGSHRVQAAASSGAPIIGSFSVVPKLRLEPTSVLAGGKVRPWMRGFGQRDAVVLKIQETGTTLKTVPVSNTGAVSPNLNTEFTIPANLPPDLYHIIGTGPSGATATAELTVTGAQSAEVPSPTATVTAVPGTAVILTSTPTAEPSPTATQTLEATATATSEPPLPTETPPDPSTTETPTS